MQRNSIISFYSFIIIFLTSSCILEVRDKTLSSEILENDGVVLTKLEDQDSYEQAQLILQEPIGGSLLPAGQVTFKFKVNGFKLGVKTGDASDKELHNSFDGQHVHFQLNNQVYELNNKQEVSVALDTGYYHIVAFLAKSYHQGIKNKNAVINTEIEVGKKDLGHINLNEPLLVYNQPRGNYEEGDKILLDFNIFNAELSEEGNKVRVIVDGKEFVISKWASYSIEGLSKGEHVITLELIDKNGELINTDNPNVTDKLVIG